MKPVLFLWLIASSTCASAWADMPVPPKTALEPTISPAVMIGGAVAAVVIAGGGLWFFRRKK